MSGSVDHRPAARRPSGLIGMLALVVVVEASIAGMRDDLVRPLGESWRFAAKAAETRAPGCDVLCFGDSLVKYGVLPKVIEAKVGLRAYGLASSGGTAPSAFFLLRRALDAGARPRAIVVDFASLMAADDGPPKLLNYPELATARDCLDLARTSNAPDFFGEAMVACLLPSARYRFEIRNNVRAAFEGRSTSERDSVKSHRLIWARERGAQPTEPVGFRASPANRLIRPPLPRRLVVPTEGRSVYRPIPRPGRFARDRRLLAPAATLARGPRPSARPGVGRDLRAICPFGRGEASERGDPRRQARGIRRLGLPRPDPSRTSRGGRVDRRRRLKVGRRPCRARPGRELGRHAELRCSTIRGRCPSRRGWQEQPVSTAHRPQNQSALSTTFRSGSPLANRPTFSTRVSRCLRAIAGE